MLSVRQSDAFLSSVIVELGVFCRIEVDSFGLFLTKAKSNVLLATKKEPSWNDVRCAH